MALNDELMDRGVVMRIHDGNITNEACDSSREEVHHVLDVTFVDDECIMLAADDSEVVGRCHRLLHSRVVDDIPASQA